MIFITFKKKIPFIRESVRAITLWPFILMREEFDTPELREEEMEHWWDQIKWGLIGFYVVYLVHYVWNRYVKKMPHQQAYENIYFEIKAHKHLH